MKKIKHFLFNICVIIIAINSKQIQSQPTLVLGMQAHYFDFNSALWPNAAILSKEGQLAIDRYPRPSFGNSIGGIQLSENEILALDEIFEDSVEITPSNLPAQHYFRMAIVFFEPYALKPTTSLEFSDQGFVKIRYLNKPNQRDRFLSMTKVQYSHLRRIIIAISQ